MVSDLQRTRAYTRPRGSGSRHRPNGKPDAVTSRYAMHESIGKETIDPIDRLSDAELIATLKSLAVSERHITARLITALVEMERRRLYLAAGCSSLYVYCTQVLHLSE